MFGLFGAESSRQMTHKMSQQLVVQNVQVDKETRGRCQRLEENFAKLQGVETKVLKDSEENAAHFTQIDESVRSLEAKLQGSMQAQAVHFSEMDRTSMKESESGLRAQGVTIASLKTDLAQVWQLLATLQD